MPVSFVGSKAVSYSSGGSSSVTSSLSAGAADNRLVLLYGQHVASAISSATYAGSSMTLAGSNSSSRLFYKNAAASGSNNLVLSTGSYQQGVFAAAAFSGVDSVTPIGSVASGAATSSSPATSSITLPTDGLIYGGLWTNYSTSLNISAGSGTTLRSSVRNGGTGQQAAGGTRTSTGGVTWSLSGSLQWRALGVPINAEAVASGSSVPRAFPNSILNL